ncbi:MFS sugar transporter [Colletotrichum karsti]|uniref:MFS sugar transporter n=1 Tax=Colletotrichum karsti TaxID=1095194 RepID=A0A9P6IDK9_9PEZI|nr:MFS sugar transporter [Colletotrichum karsti]KAF9881603.1 MFS sugar transporter [Colletotrichum karsti]
MCRGDDELAAAPANQPPAQANNPVELIPEDLTDDNVSELGASIASSSTSVSSSIFDFRVENGRTYHRYKDGKYNMPNDERENDRLDLQHNLFLLTFNNKLGLAPPNDADSKVKRVLGTDLSPSMPQFVPPNVKFEIDDLEEEWTYSQPFDYIHSRTMNSSVSDWKAYFKKGYDHLTPGGYFELQEADLFAYSDDDTLKADSALSKCTDLMYEASVKLGRPFQKIPPLVAIMEEVGFVDVRMSVFKWPSNSWPKDRMYKELGIWANENFCNGLEGFTMALFTRAHEWTREEVLVFLTSVRKDLNDKSIHAYWPILDTGSIGPVTTMPSFRETFGDFSPTMHGVIVSSVLIPGALSALVSGVMADRFGHVRLFALGAFIYGCGTGIECASPILGVFILGRLIKGIGEGMFLSNVYVQVSEISPARIRGIMTALPQFAIVTGIVTGYFMCYGTARFGLSTVAWRLPLAIASFLGFLFSLTYWVVPPSPRWLLAKGRPDEARLIVERLGLDEKEGEEMLELSSDGEHDPNAPVLEILRQAFAGFREAFSAPYRSRTFFACFLLGMQQWSGIDGVLYYAPIIFTQAGLDGEQATFLASGVSALVILGATIPATFLADKWGRKTSTILGGTLITALMVLMGSLYAAGKVAGEGAGKWVVIVSVYLFAIVYSGTWAIGIRTFLVESLPRKTRSSASSLAQASNWFANYVVALITPVLISKSSFGAYFLFAGCSLFTTIVAGFIMVETRGHSLEAIETRYEEKNTKAASNGKKDGLVVTRVRSVV